MAVMERYLLAGHSVTDVVSAAATTFKISQQTAYKWVRRIKRQWKAEFRREMAYQFAQAIARREHLFRRAVAKGDDALALRIEQDRCELLGLYPGQSTLPPTAPVNVVVMTDEQLAAVAGRGEVVARPLPAIGPGVHPATHDFGEQSG